MITFALQPQNTKLIIILKLINPLETFVYLQTGECQYQNESTFVTKISDQLQ